MATRRIPPRVVGFFGFILAFGGLVGVVYFALWTAFIVGTVPKEQVTLTAVRGLAGVFFSVLFGLRGVSFMQDALMKEVGHGQED